MIAYNFAHYTKTKQGTFVAEVKLVAIPISVPHQDES